MLTENIQRKLVSLTFILLCLAGLLYQCSLICREYFKYGVSSSTTLSQADDYILPALSTCLEFPEVFNFTAFNIKYNMSYFYDTTDRESMDYSGRGIQKLATVQDIYDFTPDAESMCDFLNIRNSSSFAYHGYDSEECYDHFNVKRFVISNLVCYKLTLKGPNVYNRENAYFTPNAHADIYFLFFDEVKFAHFDYIINVMHPVDTYPWFEFQLTQLRSRSHNVSANTNIFNNFQTRSFSIAMNKLKPPYVTNCQDYVSKGFINSFDCKAECMNKRVLEKLGKASLSYHFLKGNNLNFLSRDDFKDEKFNATYRKILHHCNKECPMNDCNFTATYTTTIGESFVAPGVAVQLPDKPSFAIKFTVTILFIDTINFICSALGVWFGLSFMSIHPNQFYKLRLEKVMNTPQKAFEAVAVLKRRFERERARNENMRRSVETNHRQITLLQRQLKIVSERY